MAAKMDQKIKPVCGVYQKPVLQHLENISLN